MQVRCPIPGCRSDNDVQAERCHRCGSPLIQYANLSGPDMVAQYNELLKKIQEAKGKK